MKFLMHLVVTISMIALFGCSQLTSKQRKAYDSDSILLESADSYTFAKRVGNSTKELLDIRYSGFFGVDTVWAIDSDTLHEVELDIQSELKQGRFKCILTSDQKEIGTLFEGNFIDKYTLNLAEGSYRIKLVGSGANGKVRIHVRSEDGVRFSAVR